MKIAIAGLFLAATIVLGACSAHKSTIQTSDGTATVTLSEDNKNVTLQTKEGTMSISKDVDTSKLGAPVYPGAQPNEQGAITNDTGTGTSMMAGFKTADSFDNVTAYYKQHLPAGSEKLNMSNANGSVATFEVGDEKSANLVTVHVTASKPGETDILITHVTKGGSARANAR